MTTTPPADDVIREAAMVLWGFHEEAADCSHRPEHIRRLFIDANAAHRFAHALFDAGLLRTQADAAVLDAVDHAEWAMEYGTAAEEVAAFDALWPLVIARRPAVRGEEP